MRKLVAGNWKMNGRRDSLAAIARISQGIARLHPLGVQVSVHPPFTLLASAAQTLAGGPVELGAQDCSAHTDGPYTGDVSAAMLGDLGVRWVILGYSERRGAHQESDALIAAKVQAAEAAGLGAIVCVGESAYEREQGLAEAVVRRQVRDSLPQRTGTDLVIAYEPIWAIGSGRTPKPLDIEAMHAVIRAALVDAGRAHDARILYGGSVKPQNAGELAGVDGVDGLLVGGASLDPADFLTIVEHVGAA